MGFLGSQKSYCQSCGMEVDPDNACHTEIGGKLYYFCRARCKAFFKKAYFKKMNAIRIDVKPVKSKSKSCH